MQTEKKRKILAVTGIRSEYDIMSSVFKKIEAHPRLELQLIVTGAHLSPTYGSTVSEIQSDGFQIAEQIESLINGDCLSSRVKGLAIQLIGMIQTVERIQPHFLLVLGDREEAMTTALIGAYLNIPVAHVAGGDRVIGNVDDQVRHAVSKLSHLHFVTCEESAERLIKMGEQPFRIKNFGNPGLDRLLMEPQVPISVLKQKLNVNFDFLSPFLILIQHVISTETDQAYIQMKTTLEAIKELQLPTFIIYPNSDAGNHQIIKAINEYENLSFIFIRQNIPRLEFVNLMRRAACLLGNSSAGILEAPILKLPVVNIGNRQKGRLHAQNVQFVPHETGAIISAVKMAVFDSQYREYVVKCENPYGDGNASQKIAETLANTQIDEALLIKDITY